METRHVRDAFKAMPVMTDRNDARGIAQLMRLGWFGPVHCKSVSAQETRAVLTARKLVQGKLYDIEMCLRGILRGFGLEVGRTTKAGFASRIIELTEHHPALEAIAKALLAVHEVLLRELNGFEKQVRKLARGDNRGRLLMTAPGVGVVVGLTYVAAIDDPGRFSSSKKVGAHFGASPTNGRWGDADVKKIPSWVATRRSSYLNKIPLVPLHLPHSFLPRARFHGREPWNAPVCRGKGGLF